MLPRRLMVRIPCAVRRANRCANKKDTCQWMTADAPISLMSHAQYRPHSALAQIMPRSTPSAVILVATQPSMNETRVRERICDDDKSVKTAALLAGARLHCHSCCLSAANNRTPVVCPTADRYVYRSF